MSRFLDEQKEKNLMNFMDDLYKSYGYVVKRISDKVKQLKGVDVELSKDDKSFVIDEKAATARQNSYTSLQTWAFEISSLNNKFAIGWALNDNCINDHYSLAYLNNNRMCTEVSDAEVLLINKKLIRQEIHKHGILTVEDADSLLSEDILLSENYTPNNKNIISFDKEDGSKVVIFFRDDDDKEMRKLKHIYPDGTALVCSYDLLEQPINFLIPRDELREMADDILIYHRNNDNLEAEYERDIMEIEH